MILANLDVGTSGPETSNMHDAGGMATRKSRDLGLCLSVSVITVCLNAVSVIDDTVQSVLEQSYAPVEYIIIDGGSHDGTLDRLCAYQTGIKVMISEPDTGLYNAMNKGLTLATGDLVVFMNAGDRFMSHDTVAQLVMAFASASDMAIAYGDYLAVDPSGRRFHIHQPEALTPWELWRKAVCHQSMVSRRCVLLDLGGFDESLRICADWDWTIRAVLGAGYRAVHVSTVVCEFRLGGVSSNRQALRHDRKQLHRRHYSNLQRFRFSLRQFGEAVLFRLRKHDFSLPWVLRKWLGLAE